MGCEGAFCVRRSVSRLPAAEVPAPALRGFVAERCPITGTSLYLVLKSNGFHYPKIRLKKFGFSSKTVPTNIAKKLPSQRCSKPLFVPLFNFAHKWPTFVFTSESGYTLGSAQRIAHKGIRGETCVPLSSCMLNKSRLAGRLLFA